MTTMTDPATLPQYNGKPVPWVTRWTNEVSRDVPDIVPGGIRGVRWAYPDGMENRERTAFGTLLWVREGLGRSGEPMYADVNTYRQRAAMTKCKCQVCGAKIDGRPVLWLIPTAEANMVDEDGTLKTTSPPTCEACIPLALELCPALPRMGWTVLKVVDYEVWGVFGNVVVINPDNEQVLSLPPQDVGYDRQDLLDSTVARQQVALLTKFVTEKTGGGKS